MVFCSLIRAHTVHAHVQLPPSPTFPRQDRNRFPGLSRMTMQGRGTEAQARPSILCPPKFPNHIRLEHEGGTLGLLVTTVEKRSASCPIQIKVESPERCDAEIQSIFESTWTKRRAGIWRPWDRLTRRRLSEACRQPGYPTRSRTMHKILESSVSKASRSSQQEPM